MKNFYKSARYLVAALVLVLATVEAHANGQNYLWFKAGAASYPTGAGAVYVDDGTGTVDNSAIEYQDHLINQWSKLAFTDNDANGDTYGYVTPYYYAKANEGSIFVGWKTLDNSYWADYALDQTVDIRDYMGEDIISTDSEFYAGQIACYNYSAKEDDAQWPELPIHSLVACFGHVKLEYIPGQSALGTMSNSDPAADFGDFAEISAQPAEDATFLYWLDDEGNIFYDNPLEITVERNITYRPMFSHPDYLTLDFGKGAYKLLGSPNHAIDYESGSMTHHYLNDVAVSTISYNTGEKETMTVIKPVEVDTTIYENGEAIDTFVVVNKKMDVEVSRWENSSNIAKKSTFPGGPYALNTSAYRYGTNMGDAAIFYAEGIVTVKFTVETSTKTAANYLVAADYENGTDIATLPAGYKYYIFDEETAKFTAATSGVVPARSGYLALPLSHAMTQYDEISFIDAEDYDTSLAENDNDDLLTNPDFELLYTGWNFFGWGNCWNYGSRIPHTVESYTDGSLNVLRYSETQEVTLEPGTYQLSTNAFYRSGVWYDTNPELSEAKLFAGTDSIDIVTLGSIELDNYANTMSEASAAFEAGLYKNVLTFTVAEEKTITIGVCGTHSYPRSWFINGPFSLKKVSDAVDTEHVTNLYVSVSREENLGYVANSVEFDTKAVCEALGIETWDQTMTAPVNVTDGSLAKDWIAQNYDGWLNSKGDVTNWGVQNDAYVCLKTPAVDGTMALCTMPGNEPAAGTEYLAKWAVFTATDTVIINTTINFTAPVPAEVTNIAQCEVVKNIVVKVEEKANTSYSGQTSTFDVAAVCEALGIETIGEADQYILNITDGALVKNVIDGNPDSWRDSNGDAAAWGSGSGMVCVKINKPATGIIDYIGCIDDTHNAGEKYTAKWAFVKGNKAAIVSVIIRFVGDTPFAIGGEGVMTYGAEQIATGHTYKWTATGSAITIDVDIDTDEAISRGAWEMGCFTLPIEELNDFLDTDVRELDESTFYALQPYGGEVAEMTSYKPGMWIDANGYADNWSTGVCYWQWYIWGDKIDKNGNKVWYDYDHNQFPGRVMIGTNPGNVASVKGSSVTSNNVIVANGEKYSFTVNVTFGDGNGISNIKSDADNQAIYDLTGRKIETPTRHGIYIQGGKKVLK